GRLADRRSAPTPSPVPLPFAGVRLSVLPGFREQAGIPDAVGELPVPRDAPELPLQGPVSGGAASQVEPGAVTPVLVAPNSTWWQDQIQIPLRAPLPSQVIDLDAVLLGALAHSPRVQAIREQPRIEETAILSEAAQFDPATFLESKYVSLSDPVGNTLTTGGPTRFRQQDYQLRAGVRKRTLAGGSLDLAQEIGQLHNNSLFLAPPYQGNARLSLRFTQPMLRGAGQAYNTSLIVLAELDTEVAANQAAAQIQDHLLEVTRAYGSLQMQRAVLLQKRRLAGRAEVILAELEARQELDAMQSQIARTRAAVAARRAELVRALTEVLNAETRVRVLVQAPEWTENPDVELIPQRWEEAPPVDVKLADAFVTAVQFRPELEEAIQQSRAAAVRVDMASNEILPTLDLVLETYLAGLAGNYQTATAFGDQFTEGQPGFTAGFVFESPWGNRAAQARLERRRRESHQAALHFRDVLSTLKAEVEVAVREVETVRKELDGNRAAMLAAEADIRVMEERWRLLPGTDGTRSFLLEDLLRAQERLASTEYEFARAQYRYGVAIAELKRATGTLLRREDWPPAGDEAAVYIP
ncbi:MAG: TolC family protein, partial [Pirellulaceae bacterium]